MNQPQLEQLWSAKNRLEELSRRMKTHHLASSSDILFWSRQIKKETKVIEGFIEAMRPAEAD